MEECHLLLTDQIDLMNPEGNRFVHDISKTLPLRGPPGQVTIQIQYFFNRDLEYLVSVHHTVFHTGGSSARNATSQDTMPLLIAMQSDPTRRFLVLSVLRPSPDAHPNDFEDLYILNLQGKLNHLSRADKVHLSIAVNLWIRNIVIRKCVEYLQLDIESYQMKLNLTQPRWDATDFLFKEDYTIVHKLRVIIYRDRNNQKKMMRETEVHKFSNGTLTRILENLDYMVKDYEQLKFNPVMENKIWIEDYKRRIQEFIKLIERRLKIRRIFRSLKTFVSARLRDINYRLINRTE
nr:hypothetical protein [Tanacetum cinerariifolium]